MPWPVHPNGLLGTQGGENDAYQISRSLRFNSADNTNLNRTFSTPTSQNIYTLSMWVKRTSFGTLQNIFSFSTTSALYFNTSDQLALTTPAGTGASTAVFRDPSAWYHIVYYQSGTTILLYVNGIAVASGSLASSQFNTAAAHHIGINPTPSQAINAYITEIYFIDGQALTPSSFAETDAITGRWKAKAYSGTYGTNGFYLKFADNSGTTSTTLGKDSSPNGNNWTPNNFSVTAGVSNDSLVDSPTNYGSDTGVGGSVRGNYCTLSAIDKGTEATLANGNLDITWSGTSGHSARSSYAIASGKWYWEITSGANGFIGIIQSNIYPSLNQWPGNSAYGATGSYAYATDGRKVNNSSYSSYGSAISNGNIVGVAYDATSGKIFFSLNGTWQASGDPAAGTNSAFSSISGEYSPAIGYGGGTASNVNSLNFGQRPFAYTAPTGFKALCTTNLPTPTIKKPSSYFDAVAFTANNSTGSVSSLSFTPDLTWIKDRDAVGDHFLHDSIRGYGNYLSSNTTGTSAAGGGVTAQLSNGFSYAIGNTNRWISWSWDEATISGMDIVGYTGTGSATTVAHSLGVAPKMMIVKSRSRAGDNWDVYHASVGATGRLYLNLTNATDTSIAPWNNTAPTSSVFTVGTAGDTNATGVTYIAYCFSEVEGFSKFGSYTGNGSADGTFVLCGFRPRYVLVKRTDASATWIVKDTARDTYNQVVKNLYPNQSNAEDSFATVELDILSNGFKLRGTATDQNASGGTYIFIAFAESPFKYARAR